MLEACFFSIIDYFEVVAIEGGAILFDWVDVFIFLMWELNFFWESSGHFIPFIFLEISDLLESGVVFMGEFSRLDGTKSWKFYLES